MPSKPTFLQFTATATDNNPFGVTSLRIWFEEVDIFVYTKGAYVGNSTVQQINMSANDIYTVRGPVCVADFFFKNAAAGDNTTIVVAGTALSDRQLKERGLA